MSTLNQLRTNLTELQQTVLTAMWRYYLEKDKWIPRRALHIGCGGKAPVRAALRAFGGSVAFESRENGQDVYKLTLLGILLSEAGLEAQILLGRYLLWARQLAFEDPEIIKIESTAAQPALNLSADETRTLGRLILLGNLWSGGASHGATEWQTGLPYDVEDIPSDDILGYLEGEILKNYDPNMPFEEGPRQTYHWRAPASAPSLSHLSGTGALDEGQDVSFLPIDVLHPRLCPEVHTLLTRGEYETAIFHAFREVEIAVREAAGRGPNDVGVSLMRDAFHSSRGPLADPSLPEAEREAMAHLFAGAMGLFKNPRSHRRATISDPLEAVELVLLANHLLRIVTKRGGV